MPKKKITSKQKKSVISLIDKWKPILYLNEWKIYLEFPNQNNSECADVLAQINCDNVYKCATMTVFNSYFDISNEDKEHSIVHELCHCLTEKLSHLLRCQHDGSLITNREIRDSTEELTQTITNVVTKLGS